MISKTAEDHICAEALEINSKLSLCGPENKERKPWAYGDSTTTTVPFCSHQKCIF